MKRYGTQVWGWEMPWWGRDEGDPRRTRGRPAPISAGRSSRRWTSIAAGPASGERGARPGRRPFPRWEMHEFELHGRSHVENPFRDAALVGEFTSPSGKTHRRRGILRRRRHLAAALRAGRGGRVALPAARRRGRAATSAGGCAASRRAATASSASIRRTRMPSPTPTARRSFRWATPATASTTTARSRRTLRREYLETRRRQRFNFVRMSIGHSHDARRRPIPTSGPGAARRSSPTWTASIPRSFAASTSCCARCRQCGMNVELLLLNFYRRPFTDAKLWTPAAGAALAALRHRPLRGLRQRLPLDARQRIRDAPRRPLSPRSARRSVTGPRRPRGSSSSTTPIGTRSRCIRSSPPARGAERRATRIDPPWRIGEFFGKDDAMDVLSQQTGQSGEGVAWDETASVLDGRRRRSGRQPPRRPSLSASRCSTPRTATSISGDIPRRRSRCTTPTRCGIPPGGSSVRAATSPPASTAPSATATSGIASTRRTATRSSSRTKARRGSWACCTTSSRRCLSGGCSPSTE